MSEHTELLHIFTAADQHYALPLAVSLSSLVTHCSQRERLSIHILDGGLTTKQKKKILAPLELNSDQIEFHDLRRASLPEVEREDHLTVSTSYRFFIPDLLEDTIEKVLYIDSDTVITRDVVELWNTALNKEICAAVSDSHAPYAKSEYGIQRYQEEGISPETPCLNAGVLLMNIPRWREEDVSRLSIEYLEKFSSEMKLVSQEALNTVLRGRWLPLDDHWNQQINPLPYFNQKNDDTSPNIEPGILHFITSSKPWQYNYPHPAGEIFFKYLDQTAWRGWRPKGMTFLQRIIAKMRRAWLS